MAQAQVNEQKRLQDLFVQLKKEINDGEGLAWLFQQKTYTDKDNKPTKATPPLRTTSPDLRLAFDSIEDNLTASNENLTNDEINFCKLTLGKTLLLLDKHVKSHRWDSNKVNLIWQAEKGTTQQFHIHCCLGYFDKNEDPKDVQKSLGWFIKKLNKDLAVIYSNHQCDIQDIKDPEDRAKNLKVWVEDGPTKPYKYFNKQTKQDYNKPVHMRDYTCIYLFNKDKIHKEGMDGYYAAGNGGIIDNLTNKERKALRKMHLDEQSADIMDADIDWEDGQDAPKVTDQTDSATTKTGTSLIWKSCATKVTSKKEVADPVKQPSKKLYSAQSTLDALFNVGCFTQEDMIIKLSDTYLELSLEPNGPQKINTLLHMNQVKISTMLTAFDCIIKFNEEEDDKPLLQTIKNMGLNEQCLKKVLGTILTKQGGKRGCIWLYGPGGTGKTLLASLICKATVNYGMVTTSNPNFPWTDCGNRNVIWAEECGNFGNWVEDFKAITGGGDVKVDTKNKQPQSIKGCVIVTSNTNITKVTVGCVETSAHAEPLKQRMVKIRCMKPINPKTKVTPGMLKRWLSSWDGQPIQLTHEMPELYLETSGPNSSATTATKSTGNSQPTTAKTAESVNTADCDTRKRAASSVPPKQHKRPRHE
uniref:Initiator protein NS1 n=1 Tax=Aleutian mink disease parvovirus TaxID=28314 RepID=A0A1S6JPX2_9VIRU|nr:putative non-structural protein 1 [Aleutian mink disease parvovirus]